MQRLSKLRLNVASGDLHGIHDDPSLRQNFRTLGDDMDSPFINSGSHKKMKVKPITLRTIDHVEFEQIK